RQRQACRHLRGRFHLRHPRPGRRVRGREGRQGHRHTPLQMEAPALRGADRHPRRSGEDVTMNPWYLAWVRATAPALPETAQLRELLAAVEVALANHKGPAIERLRAAYEAMEDRKSTRLNCSDVKISYAVFSFEE